MQRPHHVTSLKKVAVQLFGPLNGFVEEHLRAAAGELLGDGCAFAERRGDLDGGEFPRLELGEQSGGVEDGCDLVVERCQEGGLLDIF